LGQLSIEELVDRYQLRCRPIRDLIVDYLRERQPPLDFASLDAISRSLAGMFWAQIEALSPGIDSLRLPPEVVRAWKENLSTKGRTTINAAGERVEVYEPRRNAKDELLRVRAFYLDIAQWAVEEPARWGRWVALCPIGDAEIQRAKERKHRKARMDQRTRERLPVLPMLVRAANERRLAAAARLQAAQATEPGALIPDTGGTLRRAVAPKATGRHVWAEEADSGKRRNLSYEDDEAFWAFATIEVLRLTGIRSEELLELSHHSITEYRLPSTGELVPLPLLFQHTIGSEHRAFTPTAIRKLLINALAATGLTDTQRRSAHLLAPRFPQDLRDRRHHERSATPYCPGYLRSQEH
jgi:hypothetical protein